MRTTLDLDADVITAARSIARIRKSSIGAVVSELARKGLRESRIKDGVPTFPRSGSTTMVTMELVNELRDQ